MKKLRFNETTSIRFIYPLFNYKYLLWWNDFDYIMFKSSASTEIMLAMEQYDCHNCKDAMRILYQPYYDNKCIII
jgi:hypothetical protein